jgi:hypothetical protein
MLTVAIAVLMALAVEWVQHTKQHDWQEAMAQ